MEERQLWDRMEGEPLRWYARFDRFRLMGWRRSVADVYHKENSVKQRKTALKVPGDWYKTAKQWQWDERVEAWDAHKRVERDRIIALEEEEILKAEYSLKHNRIKDLNKLAVLLKEEVEDENKRWVEDVKAVGKEAYYVKQFNDAVIREYRATLDDIAKEKGERVKLTKSEITGKDGGPIQMGRDPNLQLLTDEELAQAQRIALQLSSRQEGAE